MREEKFLGQTGIPSGSEGFHGEFIRTRRRCQIAVSVRVKAIVGQTIFQNMRMTMWVCDTVS